MFFPSAAGRDEAERRESIWYQQYGEALLDHLRLRSVHLLRDTNALHAFLGVSLIVDAMESLGGTANDVPANEGRLR